MVLIIRRPKGEYAHCGQNESECILYSVTKFLPHHAHGMSIKVLPFKYIFYIKLGKYVGKHTSLLCRETANFSGKR